MSDWCPQVRTQVEVRAKYAGYIERQHEEIERQRCNEEMALPAGAGLRRRTTGFRTKCASSSRKCAPPPSGRRHGFPV